ncbi:MAG: hypothetical protein FJ297_14670 [Planctomycetes bacterium]|nr:hypothetical protein [Planctomycetota bacterium]
MKSRWTVGVILAVLGACCPVAEAWAAPNFRSLIPFGKRVEADPAKTYELTDSQGPWMILATSFSGVGADRQARELILELRRAFNLEAFEHRRTFDFTDPVLGLGYNQFGEPRKMRHQQNVRFDEIAVLVGGFDSPDSEDAQAALHKIKHAKPACLDIKRNKTSTQRFVGLREIQRMVNPDPEKREMGPMRAAFVSRNPLLPDEYFVPKGVDPLIAEMNRDVEHSLLDCHGRYTVRVATFQGESTMNLEAMEKKPRIPRGQPSKLEIAAEKAHRLTMALREKGIEAYEFHDRFESVVTIGSFASVGTPRPDGRVEIDPNVHSVIETYRARKIPLPNGSEFGLAPQSLDGVPFDVQPTPVEVPRISVGNSYTN